MSLLLFGARSPLVVDYEETAHRLSRSYTVIALDGSVPRALDRRGVRADSALDETLRALPFVACAFLPHRRRALVARAQELGLDASDPLVDPTAILARSTRIGPGSYINAGVVFGGASRLGAHVLVNRGSSIGHHCRLDDFVSIGPGVHMASNVHLGEGAVVGAGSTILPDVSIGAGAIIAAGSVVRRPVAEGAFAAGVPARERPYDTAGSIFSDTGEE